MRTLLCILIAALALVGADSNISGKWSGSFIITTPEGEQKEATALMILNQKGSEITGTVGPNEDEQFPIVKGTIEGDKISLEVEHEGATVKFALVLANDRIKGDAAISHD